MAGIKASANSDNSITIECEGDRGAVSSYTVGPQSLAMIIGDLFGAANEAQIRSKTPAPQLGSVAPGMVTATPIKVGLSRASRDGHVLVCFAFGGCQLGLSIPTQEASALAQAILDHPKSQNEGR